MRVQFIIEYGNNFEKYSKRGKFPDWKCAIARNKLSVKIWDRYLKNF